MVKVYEIADKKEVEKILQRLNFTDDLKKTELDFVFSNASYLDKEFVEVIGDDRESYDLINVFNDKDELIITYEDKRMYDYVSVLDLNEEII